MDGHARYEAKKSAEFGGRRGQKKLRTRKEKNMSQGPSRENTIIAQTTPSNGNIVLSTVTQSPNQRLTRKGKNAGRRGQECEKKLHPRGEDLIL